MKNVNIPTSSPDTINPLLVVIDSVTKAVLRVLPLRLAAPVLAAIMTTSCASTIPEQGKTNTNTDTSGEFAGVDASDEGGDGDDEDAYGGYCLNNELHCEEKKGEPSEWFADWEQLTEDQQVVLEYLWRECVITGKQYPETGSPAKNFAPNDKVTKAEALKIATFIFGNFYECTDEQKLTGPFTDVQSHWSSEVVNCAFAQKIIKGNGLFDPNSPVTMEDAAGFVYLTGLAKGEFETAENTDEWRFTKIPNNDIFRTLEEQGALEDLPNDFDPKNGLTRGQLSKIVAKLSSCFITC